MHEQILKWETKKRSEYEDNKKYDLVEIWIQYMYHMKYKLKIVQVWETENQDKELVNLIK